MAFTYTVISRHVQGNKRVITGTYASTGGSTGGDIVTGLHRVENIILQASGAAVDANQASVNETLPLTNAGGTVTIVSDADATGIFRAEGY